MCNWRFAQAICLHPEGKGGKDSCIAKINSGKDVLSSHRVSLQREEMFSSRG